ncbi:hypothetical protein Q9233_004844 [Columba guinea]|nr:hypothetical protein Q9233_004844 [Columba guinea]
MGPSKGEEEEQSVILISDDEAENTLGSSVLVVDPLEKSALEEEKSEEVVDEECELMVTFCKQANVMPHARYDCTIHLFERTECDTCSPLGKNADICDQCYCYICDKLAAECQNWTTSSLCHCNAHNKSKFWKDQRDFALAGVLVMFNLELTDIDADLRHGGSLLIKFIQELSVEYNKYLVGEKIPPTQHECICLPKLPAGQCNICRSRNTEVVYKYSGVFALVTRFLNQAEQESPKAAAVMYLGAAKEIALHKDPALLNVVPWDDMLLTTVLKGQNITGQRTQKGRKMRLWEAFPVIEARVKKLVDKENYKEVVRYLRAVKCNDTKGSVNRFDFVYECSAVFQPKCWSSLIMILGSSSLLEKSGHLHPLSLKEPPLDFQRGVLAASSGLLEELKAKINVSLPPTIFSPHLHHEACLILAVQAIQQMLFCDLPYLNSFLEIALAFGNNFWALRLLLDHLSYEEHVLHGTVNLILRDLNHQKATMLKLWQNLGPQYVGEFLCLFLTCRHQKMQSIGLFALSIITENLHM